jgi:hypothetical protein
MQESSKGQKAFRWLKRLRCKLVELHGVVESKGKSSMVLMLNWHHH